MPKDFNSEYELLRDFVAPGVLQPNLPAPVDPVLEVLVKAREMIWDHGEKGGPCATNAVYQAVDDGSPMGNVGAGTEPLMILAAALPSPRAHHDHCIAIWKWHDAEATTHADVLALFDRAISARRLSLSNQA